MLIKKYKLTINPKTREIISDGQVYCPWCFKNFGDYDTRMLHYQKEEGRKVTCLNPESIGLAEYQTLIGSLIWMARR